MAQEDAATTIESALDNLSAIQNGQDPREDQGVSSPTDITSSPTDPTSSTRTLTGVTDDPLTRVRNELDRLFAGHRMPDGLDRDDLHCYVADWKRRRGLASYNRRVEPDVYGNHVRSKYIEDVDGEYAIGIAKRLLDNGGDWQRTVAHELAHVTMHATYGSSQEHNDHWRQEARRLGVENPSSTTDTDEACRVDRPYKYGCPSGCWTSGKLRRSKKIQHPGRRCCSECGDRCVSWEAGDERPSEPGRCAVDCSDLQ